MATAPARTPAAALDAALATLEAFVSGAARREAVDAILAAGSLADAFTALRAAMRAHRWPGARGDVSLRRVVDSLDARTRREGLHLLHGWDFAKQRRPEDIAPILLVDYCERLGVAPGRARAVVALLLDQYLLALTSLVVARAWDGGDAGGALARLDAIIGAIEGPDGSGQPVVGDVETLLLVAVAYFHPEEAGYDALLARLRTLPPDRARRFARPCAAVFGSHLRWGMRFMYRSDVGALRADNGMDYPWVLVALLTLLRAYDERGRDAPDRLAVAEGVLNALTPDPWAFTGAPPACLASCAAEHADARALLARHRDAILADAERLMPSAARYSSLAFGCNFISNASVATAAIAVGDDAPLHPPLSALLCGAALDDAGAAAAESFARRLMRYATEDPARLGARGAPLIVYDPADGAHHLNVVRRVLAEWRPEAR